MTLGGNPIPSMLVADLTDRQRHDIIRVLDGMIRSLTTAMPPPCLTAPLNIGVGYEVGEAIPPWPSAATAQPRSAVQPVVTANPRGVTMPHSDPTEQ